jgi:hypothetical protein
MAGTSPAMTVWDSLHSDIGCAKVAFKSELGGNWSRPTMTGSDMAQANGHVRA